MNYVTIKVGTVILEAHHYLESFVGLAKWTVPFKIPQNNWLIMDEYKLRTFATCFLWWAGIRANKKSKHEGSFSASLQSLRAAPR